MSAVPVALAPDASRGETLLQLRDVSVVHRRRGHEPVRAVVDVSLDVAAGEIVGLVGESGCGKSTLARAAVGIHPLDGGTVTFEGHSVAPLSRRARPARYAALQMVFQNPYSSLNPRRRVGAQIGDALPVRALGRGAQPRRVADVLERVGLSASAAERYPHEFSGGQRQRIAIARALAADPRVIVLDEPLSSLDASAQAQVANLLGDLTRELGLGLLLISHDLAIVRHITHRLSVMYLGTLVEEGPTGAVWSSPLHPYATALIGAVPHADGHGVKPAALPGEVPDPARPPIGCRFHPRCPLAFAPCAEQVPALQELEPGRRAACFAAGSTPRD